MNFDTIFTVRNEDLGRLDPERAVQFFSELLWAEARRIGVEISKISVSSAVDVPDGGIDATVDEVQSTKGCGIIKPGTTSYQIKSGKTFQPSQESAIKTLLFGEGKVVNKETLGESIRACLDVNGAYVLVCTGIDLVDTQHRSAHNHIKESLQRCGYPHPKVEVWSQNNLIGFLKSFPSLALRANGRGSAVFQTHSSWARDADMRVKFVPGQEQEDMITNIQNELRRNDDTIHVRVLGEPGIGKTKLLLEATRTDDLSPLVIYCTATQHRDSDLMNEILRDDNHFSTILVIDECDTDSRSYIWNKLRHCGSRIKIITIYNDYEDEATGITYFDTPPLDAEHVLSIIESYQIPADVARRYTEFCSGSPRVAHVIAQNLLNHPDDVLKPLGTVDVWERYVVGNSDPNSLEVKERKRILRYIALFKRFGYSRPVSREAGVIAQKARIEWERFQEIVHEFKTRRILQGETTLYITPKALHIKLWTEWWENYGTGFDLEEFTQDLTPKLVEWFYEMFAYAHESEATLEIVKTLLGPSGPFRDGEYLKTRLGSRFFLALTEGHPEAALRCLKNTMRSWDREILLQFREGRRNIIWALQKIAVWQELFADAARLLLDLAEAENEGYSNNASGVFAELFSPGPGKVAPTQASPADRFPVLKAAFTSGSRKRRDLALKACNIALESTRFSRVGSPETQGLRQQPDMWMPKTYGELWDSYIMVWELLEDRLPRLAGNERKDVADVLLGRARGLCQIQNLSKMILNTVATIARNRYVDERHVIETINAILHYHGEDLPAETRGRWEQLMDELVDSDFHSMMKRYVGMELLEDLQLDDDQDYVDRAQPKIEALAQQVVDSPSILQSELDWLVTTEAAKGYDFGYQVGKRDNSFTLLPVLLEAQRSAGENASAYFLGGYFRSLYETDSSMWETQLDALINDAKLRLLIPELTHRSGLTDRAGLRLLNLAKNRIINVNHFGFFAYGQAINNLSNKVFTKWTTFLLSVADKPSVSLVLNLFYRYFVFQKPKLTLPLELTFRLLAHPVLFNAAEGSRSESTMTEYYWTRISIQFIHVYPDKKLELAELMLSYFGAEGSIVGPYSQTCAVLDKITETSPAQIWKRVLRYLDSQDYSSRKLALERWLREGSSSDREEAKAALLHIPNELIWEWIDADVENRAWYVAANLVPKVLSLEKWGDSLVRKFLVRYGGRDDVDRNLIGNYLTESFSGPTSLHYEGKKHTLLCIKKGEISHGEDNQNVIHWIDTFVNSLEEEIGRARIEEERKDF